MKMQASGSDEQNLQLISRNVQLNPLLPGATLGTENIGEANNKKTR
jgi:hypothetical protein